MAADPPTLPGVATRPVLKGRAAIGLAILQETDRPLTSREFGSRIHERQGHHGSDTCQWCPSTGETVGKQLRKAGYAKKERNVAWVAVNEHGKPWHAPAEPTADCCSEFPFCRCAA